MAGTSSLVDLALPSATVVSQAAEGDRAAFARLVDAYHADMSRVAFVVCGDRETAADAVQAAWVIAWRKLRTVRDPERARAWLVSVAANEARQAVRHQRRLTMVELGEGRVATLEPDPSDAVEHVDVDQALARLDADDRVLIALRYLAGLDAVEIGSLVGMTPSGVRGHLSRLMARLRRDLGDD